MADVVKEMLAELQQQRAGFIEEMASAQASIDSGAHNAFVELAFRRAVASAGAQAMVLFWKIEVLKDLAERMEKECHT